MIHGSVRRLAHIVRSVGARKGYGKTRTPVTAEERAADYEQRKRARVASRIIASAKCQQNREKAQTLRVLLSTAKSAKESGKYICPLCRAVLRAKNLRRHLRKHLDGE